MNWVLLSKPGKFTLGFSYMLLTRAISCNGYRFCIQKRDNVCKYWVLISKLGKCMRVTSSALKTGKMYESIEFCIQNQRMYA